MSDLARALIADVTAGILVLKTRDGVEITIGQAMERARNIVAGLLGNYEIRKVQEGCDDNATEQGRHG